METYFVNTHPFIGLRDAEKPHLSGTITPETVISLVPFSLQMLYLNGSMKMLMLLYTM